MRDNHFVQVVLIVSGDTEEVQLVTFLIISDLERHYCSEEEAQLKAHCGSFTLSRATLGPWQHCSTLSTTCLSRTHVTVCGRGGGRGVGGAVKHYYHSDSDAQFTCSDSLFTEDITPNQTTP